MRHCKYQIILLCQTVLSLFRTEPFTRELIAKRHSLSCHYKRDYYNLRVCTEKA